MASEIVVGYDGSDCAQIALASALDLAHELGDRLVIVFGYEPYHMGGEIQDHRAALEEYGKKVTASAAEQAKSKGVESEIVLVNEEAADALVGVAKARGARMIVVGTYGDSPWKGAFLGSTPHKLVHISETPVLVVRARND